MNYITIKSPAKASFIEKRSEFIGYLSPVTTNDEAVEFINSIKAEHRKAKHNVYAYILRNDNIVRYSDDGEPQGTAGVPVLDVLQKNNLTDICCVVKMCIRDRHYITAKHSAYAYAFFVGNNSYIHIFYTAPYIINSRYGTALIFNRYFFLQNIIYLQRALFNHKP